MIAVRDFTGPRIDAAVRTYKPEKWGKAKLDEARN
jgi:hypothetical protein